MGRALGISDRNDRQVIWFEYGPDGKLSAARDLTNRRVEYRYTEGRLSSVKDVLTHETLYDYDTKGRITKVTHPASSGPGRTTTVAYDSYGGVASVLDNNGNGWFFDYDYDQGKNEFYARIRTSAGMVKEIWYDKDYETKRIDVNGRSLKKIAKDGRALVITDENGNVTRKDYDEWDNLTRVVNPDGSEVANEYEHAHNRLAKSTNERGVVTRYTYDGAGNLTRKVEAEGTPSERATEYAYDADGNRLSIKVLGDASTAEALTTMTYDANGNMGTLTDPEGNRTRFTHNIMGNILTKQDARGKVWTYGYDDAGRLTSTRDPLTNLTQIFYDEVGNKQREIDAELKETTYEYDVRGNLTKRTDALGNATLFTYNPDGKLVKQTDAEGKEIRYEYDLDGRLKKTIDGNGNEIAIEYESGSGSSCPTCSGARKEQPSRIVYPTFVKEFRYDARGRKTVELDVLSATETYTTTFSYDSTGNLASKKDREERTTSYEYDELNRLKRVIDPLSQATEYTYDDRDNLVDLRDANENVTQLQYDRNNRLVREIWPMAPEMSYQYDPVGNLSRKVDAKGQKTEYGYDDAGRRLGEVRYYAGSDDTTPVKTVTFTHDRVGNLKTYADGTTSALYGYDDVYRKTSESVNYGSFSLGYAYDYYRNGRKKSFTGPDGVTYQYAYDDANRLASVVIPNQGSITFSSYLWNRPTTVVLPGGSRREYSYDPLMRTQAITVKDPLQNAIMGYTYAYDRMDNITGKATEHGPYGYGYDELYRLKTVDNPTITDEAFTYDPVGNRVTSAGTSGSWNYNANNELSDYNGVSFEYDANGNTTKKTVDGGVSTFIYDTDNRMVRVVEDGSGTVIAAYYYDPFGRRLWKEVGGTRTCFLYANEGLIGEYDAAGAEIKTYGYKSGSTWTTDPLFMKQAGQYFFYQNDRLGTPQKMTNVNGGVIWSAKYESFGRAQVEIGSTVENNIRQPGQYYDQETGLHYNYFRHYDPKVGRFFQRDPISLRGGINLYAYVRNNPLKYKDPLGLFEWETGDTGETGNMDPWAPICGLPKHYPENSPNPDNSPWSPITELPKHYPEDSPNPDNSKVCIECDRDCFGLIPPPWVWRTCVACISWLKLAKYLPPHAKLACIAPCAGCAAGIAIPRIECMVKYCRVGVRDECGNCQH